MNKCNLYERKILSGIFFLIIFVFYYTGITFFPHMHTHGDHSTFVHSHPYKKDCNGNAAHTHTKGELVLIAALSHFVTSGLLVFASIVLLLQPLCKWVYLRKQDRILLTTDKTLFFLRAPPYTYSV